MAHHNFAVIYRKTSITKAWAVPHIHILFNPTPSRNHTLTCCHLPMSLGKWSVSRICTAFLFCSPNHSFLKGPVRKRHASLIRTGNIQNHYEAYLRSFRAMMLRLRNQLGTRIALLRPLPNLDFSVARKKAASICLLRTKGP
ncbi:hypothetical protein FOWG_00151 [Fusarium oxysporum f. sp. lycopersici MN25]|uniref:Uncharacterized protein n=1 Tax=Fusarium oxysporum Fo47 TaxID=660027 RepID=W9KPN1_FUSOX|nr:hypothetical protein FOZG_07889 [Fusarium oxysporum Fo47]EWZ99747.1 hypothetical protein FOWG_00151 [Fusarium oxysporum f. sp. lycopersici MN25]